MSGGGGGIIIRKKLKAALETNSVLDQLGPSKKARAQALVAQDSDNWSNADAYFALRCIKDAYEDYE